MSEEQSLNLSSDDFAAESYLLHQLVDGIPDRIYFKDRESRFILVNQAMRERHGENMLGKTDFDLFSDNHAAEAFADEQRILETGETIVGKEEKETWNDGVVTWASTTKLPLKNSEGEIIGTFGISRDITDKILAREALRDAQDRKVMLESLGAACHHLGQPAAVLVGNLELIKNALSRNDYDVSDLLEACEDAAEKVTSILAQLNHINEYKTVKYLPDSDNNADQILDLD